MLSANVSNKHHIEKETSSASDDLTRLSGAYKSPAATIKYCHTQSWQYNTCLESKVLTEICFCRHPGQNDMVLTEMCHIWQELSALFWFEFWFIRTFLFFRPTLWEGTHCNERCAHTLQRKQLTMDKRNYSGKFGIELSACQNAVQPESR